MTAADLTVRSIEVWLREENDQRLNELWSAADEARRQHVGDEVHLRGLVEISNHCARHCLYCGLRADNRSLKRYRMTADEILSCATEAHRLGYGTLVMQSGEDYGLCAQWLAQVIRRVKSETPLAVTLSLGERPTEDLALWREAGADRYLLRFETSDRELYERIHPPRGGLLSDRLAMLPALRELGYEVGSGVMVGIPGQSYASLARDIELFRTMDLDMIGCGPYIPHPDTPLGRLAAESSAPGADQVPGTELMAYKVIALTRLVRPDANIPATTALAVLNPDEGRRLGLTRGANVIMPNLTPAKYRVHYEIYPGKPCHTETAEEVTRTLTELIASLGRTTGRGPGARTHGPRGITSPVR